MHTTFEALGSDTVVIWVHGDLDAFSAPDLKQQLFAALDNGFRRVVLEMSACGFVDSTGLGVLVSGLKRAGGRDVVMAAPSPEVRRVLEIVGLDRVLPLCTSRAEALRQSPSA
ncbi:MAG TPA: STAS domain-containing protein [Thermoleophilia bacterium]|nr:STAS domain-containing protein [Thermoleophilia bacterium]